MTTHVHLLGPPRILRDGDETYRFRSRKSWALLAYLLLADRAPSRSHLAELLFDAADDPLRALRWNLTEIRRALGPDAVVEGDPVQLVLGPGTVVDVDVVTRGTWQEAVRLPAIESELLESVNVRGAAGFESWLVSEQRRMAAAAESILHEAALGAMSQGHLDEAVGYARRAAAMSPLDENHQALLIRLLRMTDDEDGAQRHFDACCALFARELGVVPGPAMVTALEAPAHVSLTPQDGPSIAAIVEAGAAAVAAGATEAGVQSLRTAVLLADGSGDTSLQVSARLGLAEALIHSLRGLDEEGLATLHSADAIAQRRGDRSAMAHVRVEVGYVDFLRARYERAQVWLEDALALSEGSPGIQARARAYLGSVASDLADYPAALDLLQQGAGLAREVGDVRLEAYAVSMVGRIHLLRGDLEAAEAALDQSLHLAERDHWLAFVPWPQSMRGDVERLRGRTDAAEKLLGQAFARACQLGDPCWEGMSARGLALMAESTGATERAFDLLADARVRCNRVADPYVWLDAYILDAQCELGIRHRHPDTRIWITALQTLAQRTSMREMIVRSLHHAAALGDDDAAAAADLLAENIDNPELRRLRLPSSP